VCGRERERERERKYERETHTRTHTQKERERWGQNREDLLEVIDVQGGTIEDRIGVVCL
jgi:hypothetical protein